MVSPYYKMKVFVIDIHYPFQSLLLDEIEFPSSPKIEFLMQFSICADIFQMTLPNTLTNKVTEWAVGDLKKNRISP